jgi:hypothetical protein
VREVENVIIFIHEYMHAPYDPSAASERYLDNFEGNHLLPELNLLKRFFFVFNNLLKMLVSGIKGSMMVECTVPWQMLACTRRHSA